MKSMKLYIAFVLGLLALGVAPAKAAEGTFVPDGAPLLEGEWRVTLEVSSPKEKINTLAGSVRFPTDILEVKRVEDARSITNLWVEKPAVQGGLITFAGITPGGFQGEKGEVFTIVFRVKQAAKGILALEQPQALLNDGKGTTTTLTVRALPFTSYVGIIKPLPVPNTDIVPPEPFILELGRSTSIYDNKWFVSFAAHDKDSGIEGYEVQETRGATPSATGWQKIDSSPYILKDQSLKTSVFVRAFDYGGNSQQAALILPLQAVHNYQKYVIWGILPIVLFVGLFLWIRKRRQRP